MSGPLLSRENLVSQSASQPAEDVQNELRKLESKISAGDEKTVDAYFRFLCFVSKNQRQLADLLTPAFLKPHCIRLHREFVANPAATRNDAKFVQCLLWMAQFNPRMYKDMVEKNIGDRLAVTYVMYARVLSRKGRADEAVALVKKGIECNALPINYLEDALKELQNSSILQSKENGSHSSNQTSFEHPHTDPYQRYAAEVRDFAPDKCRTYDFRAVYPEFHAEEFQFEERRLLKWRQEQKRNEKKLATENELKAKDEMIESLKATIRQLQNEKNQLQQKQAKEAIEQIEESKKSELFDELTDTMPLLTSTQQPQKVVEVSVVSSQPIAEATTAIYGNKTEMMTRDMRELFWNGTLDSTNLAASTDTILAKEETSEMPSMPLQAARPKLEIFEENPQPLRRISALEESESLAKRKSDLSPNPAKRFAICTDENQPGTSSHPPPSGSPMPKMKTSDENPPLPFDKDSEDKENVAPEGYRQPAYHSRRTSGILVDAEGFETAPIPVESDFDDDDLGVTLIDDPKGPSGRAASTPRKNTAPDFTWRVTEVLSGEVPLVADENPEFQTEKSNLSGCRLSTILEASKESGSSGSSNSLGTPSVARVSMGGNSASEESLPSLSPIVSDPFSPALRNKVILGSKIPYETITEKLPAMKKKCTIQYSNGYRATVVKLVGEGGFAKVYFAQRDLDDDDENLESQEFTTCILREDRVALKVTNEITAGLWEYYILKTLSGRLTRFQSKLPCIRKSIPEPHCAAYYTDGFLISLPYLPYGSLVDLVNKYERNVPEMLARYLVLELMVIIMRLHDSNIIHGDLKPDNVLFRKIPTIQMMGELRSKTQCLCLIDFGQAIDLTAYPSPNITFSHVVNEEIQKCPAMREQRDWLFDFDWFGVANCAHTLLFGEYIEVDKTPSGDYSIKKKLPRYWNPDWWNMFFQGVLNMTAATSRPDHIDNPIKKIIELGGASLNNRETMRTLSLKLIHLNSILQSRN